MIKRIIIVFLTLTLLTACDNAVDTPTESRWYDALPRESWSQFEKIDVSSDWFEVYKITDNTFAIYEPFQWQEAISYLLIGYDKAMLVDTLQGVGDLKSVVDQLTALPVVVMNTHSHYDHVSGNHQFETIYGLNTPYTAGNTMGHDHESIGDSMTIDTIWKNLPQGFDLNTYESKSYEIDHFVEDGGIISLGGRDIEVVYIPGHTPDSVILIDKTNRLMMTGDSFYPAPIYVYSDTSSFQDYFLSSQTMFGYINDVDFLLPGHNETMQPANYLNDLRAATMAIINPTTPYGQVEGNRSYDFGAFSIIVKDPLDFGVRAGE
ncbi:MAG: MBL fold metallo-hydrolase [Emcibacteraceae bacterium]|nr:MBL fold metallo-hydrolase [Emcibacteraceae bacterium]